MDRTEHLQWCKDRAMEYVKTNDLTQAFASFTSDMSKHEKTAGHSALMLGVQLMFSGNLSTPADMEEWILGFN
jgi:hypothetical protein